MVLGLVGLLHVDQLLLEAAVLLQELLQLGGVVLEAVWVRGARRLVARRRRSVSTRALAPGGEGRRWGGEKVGRGRGGEEVGRGGRGMRQMDKVRQVNKVREKEEGEVVTIRENMRNRRK